MAAISPFRRRRGLRPGLLASSLALALTAALVPAAAPAASAAGTTATARSATAPAVQPGYWLAASDGGVFSFGGLPFYGSMGGKTLNKPVVGMAATPDGRGYWEVASDGGIFSFGDAAFQGSMGSVRLNEPVVGMATDEKTGGYWLVASDGGIFSFDAPFFGSMGGKPLNEPVVGMAATPDGQGYWLVASDGGIFSFGDASFQGSMGGTPLNKPIVGMAVDPVTGGYWMVASDGGIFSFNAPFEGSEGSNILSHPVVGMGDADGTGYWMTDANGGVMAFGDAGYAGSAPQQLNAPVVGMTEAPGDGAVTNMAYPSGAYGFDISNFQCNAFPSGHTIGVVEVVGAAYGALNSCFSQEVQWAGAGLNLYIFLNGGDSSTAEPGCAGSTRCNYGYGSALRAYQLAAGAGAPVGVTWWLDVEGPGTYWGSDPAANTAVVQGAIAALRAEGINNIGIYSTSYQWDQITGGYQAKLPQWVAGAPSASSAPAWCTETYRNGNAADGTVSFDGGPVWLIQFPVTQGTNDFDGDYAC